jgi:hypothetical protein
MLIGQDGTANLVFGTSSRTHQDKEEIRSVPNEHPSWFVSLFPKPLIRRRLVKSTLISANQKCSPELLARHLRLVNTQNLLRVYNGHRRCVGGELLDSTLVGYLKLILVL